MASNNTSLMFSLLARDVSVGKTLGGLERRTQGFMRTLGRLAGVFGVTFGATAIVRFAADSVRAFADAEKAQLKLEDAYKRFPALAQGNIDALRKYNEQRAKVTRFDDDATAAAQAQLAQLNLNETQLRTLTPLMQDFAAKTGSDLPQAAEDLVKALLGSGRALKVIGVDFEDAGSVTANYDQIVEALRKQVGGFAEQEGETAAGKLEILRNRFGEVEEKVGEALMPALDTLLGFIESDVLPGLEDFSEWFKSEAVPGIQGAVEWLGKYSDILGPAATAVGTLTAAQWLLNVAMDANPVGAVILGLTALIGLGAALATNFGGIQNTLYGALGGIQKFGQDAVIGLASFAEGIVNTIIDTINGILGVLGGPKMDKVDFTSGLKQQAALSNYVFAAGAAGGTDGALRAAQYLSGLQSGGGGMQGAPAQLFPGAPNTYTAYQTPTAPKSLYLGGIPGMADGGIVSAATLALIGEGGEPEVVSPLSKLPQVAAAAGLGGGSGVTLEFHGSAAALAGLFDVFERKTDGSRVLVSKMGKQRS